DVLGWVRVLVRIGSSRIGASETPDSLGERHSSWHRPQDSSSGNLRPALFTLKMDSARSTDYAGVPVGRKRRCDVVPRRRFNPASPDVRPGVARVRVSFHTGIFGIRPSPPDADQSSRTV